MNYKHLSKYHYIYEVITNERELRIERHPIVYSNKYYIYFVRSGANRAETLNTQLTQTEANYDEMLAWLQYATGPDSWGSSHRYYILDKEGVKKLKELVERFNDEEDLDEFRRQTMLKKLRAKATGLKCSIEAYEYELAKANEKIKELGGDA